MDYSTKDRTIKLDDGLTMTWDIGDGEVPEALRHLSDRTLTKRLVRNAGSVFVAFGQYFVKAQKGDMADVLDGMEGETFMCVFNGVDLYILGVVGRED